MKINYYEEIARLKRDLNAVVLAHNYQKPEVQEVADYVGDSLELSIKASETKARYIVFCGVDFMAEQAAILNEDSIVLHPDPEARCPMAAMITPEEVLKAKKKHPKAPIVMYVNSPALVKAYSDYVVTSANAARLVAALKEDTVIFGPDRHLAEYIAEVTGKTVIPVPANGHCPVHQRFSEEAILELKRIYGEAEVLVHPECPRGVRRLADYTGSTSQMIVRARRSDSRVFLVGTEVGIIYRMLRENPGKVFIPASSEAICWDMKKITIEKVYLSLKNKVYRVVVDKEVAERVRKAIKNTFLALGEPIPWKK
ncbi:MAG: quinolinate synthase NadA [Acidilobaceae archaeon]